MRPITPVLTVHPKTRKRRGQMVARASFFAMLPLGIPTDQSKIKPGLPAPGYFNGGTGRRWGGWGHIVGSSCRALSERGEVKFGPLRAGVWRWGEGEGWESSRGGRGSKRTYPLP